MDRIVAKNRNMAKWGAQRGTNDPELAAIRDNLFYGQIADHGTLDDRQRALSILAALTAGHSLAALGRHALAALKLGISPLEIREALYQCAPYVGFPRVEEALEIVNGLFAKHGVTLPLPAAGTVTESTRLADGLALQEKIFGKDAIDQMRDGAPQGQKEIVADYLTAFCFGDFYTRKALDLKIRELVTFSAIVALGGCDAQARAHAGANASVGNSKQNLVDALAAMLPFIGFPRTLNGLAAVNAALPEPIPFLNQD